MEKTPPTPLGSGPNRQAGPSKSSAPCRLASLLTVAILLAAICLNPIHAAAEAGEPHFDTHILPLLKQRCVRCHGPLKREADLSLASAASVARAVPEGPVVVPGDPAGSKLWQLVDQDEMPPDNPLDKTEKALLRDWIASGARGLPSREAASNQPDEHWAFQRLQQPDAPDVHHPLLTRSTLDRHLQARLEAAGLALSPEAPREMLLRRLSLDLTGLPPTPDDLQSFLQDPHPDAYERNVDRYLASPQYGERWGKHWLDAAGYADSNGYFSADTDRPWAFRYRDYVVRSLSADKPFDRFLQEQLAGDEMADFRPGEPTSPEVIELLEATHFLRNGQDGTDIGVQEPEAFEIDRRAALEAVVQVTATSLLGVTLHCARCHDHKFDPITQREYYQFQALFFPAFNPQDWVNPQDRLVYAYVPGEREIWEQKEQRIREQLDQLRADFQSWLALHREPSEVLFEESFADQGWQQRWSNTAPGDDAPGGTVSIEGPGPNAARVQNGQLQLIAGTGEAWLSTKIGWDWTPDEPDAWIQATFDLVDDKVDGTPAERIGYSLAAIDFDDSGDRSGGNLLIDGNPKGATTIYRDYPGPDQKPLGQIGELPHTPGRNYGVRVTNIGDAKFRVEQLVDGFPDGQSQELAAGDLPDGGFAFFFCCGRSYIVDQVRIERSRPDAPSTAEDRKAGPEHRKAGPERRKAADERRQEYEKRRAELKAESTPEPGRPIAWVTDKSATPPLVPLLTRGLYHLRGEPVEPAVPRALTDTEELLELQPGASGARTTGHRTALAAWLTRPHGRASALVARVYVNRIWGQYLGRAVAPTTDNLGVGGEPPTHPELLDRLAFEFIHRDWSPKAIHREIVSSAVYRQASTPHPQGLAIDPDNRLWWRWPVRRLDAETIRDSMLAVAGQLDLARFGPYVPTHQTPIGEVVVDEQARGARRRSVYLQQRRSQTLSLLKVFDAPVVSTICTMRPSSTVPLQSLALLNSDFSVARAEAMARRIQTETGEAIDGQLLGAWLLAAGRSPTTKEAAIAREFLITQRQHYADSGSDAALWALADFCQMLLASNAFLYLE